ncbi:Hypothetical protein ETEE_3283 [Edwardsiella anguillarum ET080813]|uniref:Uncharacterized protein n=1 Tax=Edwardsiella anguillarum ET080813 TaxID=667120 RepID=A0A076LSS4_9GAMM|nr:Hypothetical protein ETEE_3283 [Edwardsiella anguillarum ET080813]
MDTDSRLWCSALRLNCSSEFYYGLHGLARGSRRARNAPIRALVLSARLPVVCAKWIKKQHSIRVGEDFR